MTVQVANTENYNKLLSLINLSKIELLSLACFQNASMINQDSYDIAVKYGVDDNIERNGVEVFFKFFLEVVVFENEDDTEKELESISQEKILFKITSKFNLIYQLDITKLDEENKGDIKLDNFNEELEKFSERNVPINVWPYARELVSNLTTRMGFPPLVLPMYKNTPKY